MSSDTHQTFYLGGVSEDEDRGRLLPLEPPLLRVGYDRAPCKMVQPIEMPSGSKEPGNILGYI